MDMSYLRFSRVRLMLFRVYTDMIRCSLFLFTSVYYRFISVHTSKFHQLSDLFGYTFVHHNIYIGRKLVNFLSQYMSTDLGGLRCSVEQPHRVAISFFVRKSTILGGLIFYFCYHLFYYLERGKLDVFIGNFR